MEPTPVTSSVAPDDVNALIVYEPPVEETPPVASTIQPPQQQPQPQLQPQSQPQSQQPPATNTVHQPPNTQKPATPRPASVTQQAYRQSGSLKSRPKHMAPITEDKEDTISEISTRTRPSKPVTQAQGPIQNKLKSVESLADDKFRTLFGTTALDIGKLPDTDTISRFNPETLNGMEERKLTVEDRTQLSPLQSFTDTREMMNTRFAYKEGRLSSTLDILSQYMRGQKILYLEAKSYCEFFLYRLMIPTLFISTTCSVVGGLFAESPIISIAVAAANGFNTLLLALINYFKLDARAEAHRMTAYSFDQLISECEFTSGKILLSNLVLDPELGKGADKFDLKYVQDFMTTLENKVKEVKQKNQFIIPDSIRNRYPNIYYTNIFALVSQSQIQEMIITNQLKLASNAFTEVENRIIKGNRDPEIYEDYNIKLQQKNDLIERILEHRRSLVMFDHEIRSEVEYNRRRWCKCLRCWY
jgi:hypothetical protein